LDLLFTDFSFIGAQTTALLQQFFEKFGKRLTSQQLGNLRRAMPDSLNELIIQRIEEHNIGGTSSESNLLLYELRSRSIPFISNFSVLHQVIYYQILFPFYI
jgi:hypothetical protein